MNYESDFMNFENHIILIEKLFDFLIAVISLYKPSPLRSIVLVQLGCLKFSLNLRLRLSLA